MPNIINKQLFIVDTSIARPISFQIMRGETVQITCRFRDHLDPIVVAGMTATAYWHSREMAPTSWYSSNAVTLESDKAIWNWVPDFGADGAKEYEWYIKVTDSATNISYRAFGAIQMVGSPDSDPGEAPEAHSDYYTKDETNAAIATATEHLVSDSVEINGHALTGNIDLTADDVEAAELIDIAAPFKSIIQYAVGDLATRDGNLYKCVTRYKGPWDASKFEETTVQEALAMKAMKVSGAVENDFASLDSTGGIKDSGKKAEDFERSHAYTYITDTDNVTKAFDWSGTVTLQMVENAGYSHDDIKAIVLGDKVTGLGLSTFNFQANLISVDFGEGIQTIGENAFFNDYRLPSLVFPPSLQSIGQNAFANCNGVTYCLFEQKTEAQVKAMPNYGDWGIVAPLTVASQQWVDNRIDNLDASDVGAVPTGRTVNGKSLSQNVTLTASDVGALPDTYTAPVASVNTKTGAVVLDGTDLLVGGNSDFAEATVEAEIVEFGTGLAQLNSYMPAEVSSSNKLADKAFVTDSITQGTAIYRGSYATKAALNAIQWQTSDPESPNFVSNNDYAVVQADESQDGGCWRYIYVIDTAQSISRWEPQYEINESPLTQAQLDALNSTATKAKIDSIADKATKVSGATNGNFAGLDSNGNLTDSTKKASDFVPVTRTINSKALSADVTLTAADVGAATVADATLTTRETPWESTPGDVGGVSFSIVWFDLEGVTGWMPKGDGISGEPKGDQNSTHLEWTATTEWSGSETLVANRTIYPGFKLGNQNDKPLAKSADFEAHKDNTAVHTKGSSIAAEFDATQSYAVGDYVMKDGQLYKCTTAHSGAWAAADFTAAAVTDEMGSGGGGGGGGVDPDVVAPEFDSTDTYAIGDYVMYDGAMYRCTTAHSGAWNANDFADTSVADEIGNIETILEDINGSELAMQVVSRQSSPTWTVSATDLGNITSIGSYAFNGCTGLTSVTIPSSVTSIGSYAFGDCIGLTSVTIPSSVTSIGAGAFSGCSSLTSVTIPDGVTSIGNSTFYNCSGLTSVTIPNSVTSIGSSAFKGCDSLTSATFGNSLASIADNAFHSTAITSISFPASLRTIGQNAFTYSALTSITVPNTVTTIGNYAFSHCTALRSATFQGAVNLGTYSTFEYCSNLESVTLAEGITSLPTSFVKYSAITSIEIPNSVTQIRNEAFRYCSSLATIDFGSTRTTIPQLNGSQTFDGIASGYQILVPAALLNDWKATNYWSAVADHIVAHS